MGRSSTTCWGTRCSVSLCRLHLPCQRQQQAFRTSNPRHKQVSSADTQQALLGHSALSYWCPIIVMADRTWPISVREQQWYLHRLLREVHVCVLPAEIGSVEEALAILLKHKQSGKKKSHKEKKVKKAKEKDKSKKQSKKSKKEKRAAEASTDSD